jgi:hypothetical protein
LTEQEEQVELFVVELFPVQFVHPFGQVWHWLEFPPSENWPTGQEVHDPFAKM